MSQYPRSVSLILLLAMTLGLAACSSLNSASTQVAGLVTPYKMDIVQGNFVSKEQAAAIKPGMSRSQVRDIMGTPLLTSLFHADRWDYVFTFKRRGVAAQERKVTVFFKADVLERPSPKRRRLPCRLCLPVTRHSNLPRAKRANPHHD